MRKVRVLELVYSLNAGGIETFIVNLLKNMDMSNLSVELAVIKPQGIQQFYDEQMEQLGITIHAVGDFRKGKIYKYITSRIQLYQLIKNGKYDVVHIHSGQVDKLPDMFVCKWAHVPNIIIHSHNQGIAASVKLYHIRQFLQSLARSIYSNSNVFLFSCSKAAAQWAYTKKVCNAGKVKIINNGLDSAKYRFNDEVRRRMRDELQIGDSFVIGHIGRFNYQKNHEFLIDVFYEIQKKESNTVLLLLGTGELLSQIQQKVYDLGIADKVCFVGVTERIPEYLQAMDLFLFPSRFEGLPVVGIEVQAAALQTIASDRITKEVAVTPYFRFMSLEEGKDKWADAALEYRDGYFREDTSKMICHAGFDIHEIAEMIGNFYRNLAE